MDIKLVTDDKIAETSSKGNQEKWFDRSSGLWYKLDQFGYEALSETLISFLLTKSNIETDTPFTFARYSMERINAHGRERTGCSSENFLDPSASLITVSRLISKIMGKPASQTLSKLTSDKKRIAYIAESVAEYTGLKEFPRYITLMFEIDALFCNDDRHLNNIAVIEQGGKYKYCPIFDNAAALLSNVRDYRMDIDPKALVSSIKARPFHTTFTRQMNTARALYGKQLSIPHMDAKEIRTLLHPLLEYYPERDRGIITDRVTTCIITRQKFM